MLKVGDTVEIINVEGIFRARINGYVNGDIAEIIKTPLGTLAIPSKLVEYPLAIYEEEIQYLRKLSVDEI